MNNRLSKKSQDFPRHSKSWQARRAETSNTEEVGQDALTTGNNITEEKTKQGVEMAKKSEEEEGEKKPEVTKERNKEERKTPTENSNRLELAELMLVQTYSGLRLPDLDPEQRNFLEKHVVSLEKAIGNWRIEALREMLVESLGEAGKKKTPDTVVMSTLSAGMVEDMGNKLGRGKDEEGGQES